MPRETKPSLVYLVRGEGVRNNAWVLQDAHPPLEYSKPPVENLDSVPSPFGPDLRVRIFEKGTKTVPDFFSSNPATAVVAAEAEPMVPPPSQTPRTLPQPSPDPSPPSRPSAPSLPDKPSTIPPATSSKPTPTSPSVLPKPPNAASRDPSRSSVDTRRLRNFRNLSVKIIADPRYMPPPYFLLGPTTSSPTTDTQPKPQTKKASEESIRKTSLPLPSTPPKSTAMASQERSRTSLVHMKAPQPPSLSLPVLVSSANASQRQTTAATPSSAFGRWKSSSPMPTPGQKSPQLPSPPKTKPAVADKSRQKPWQKVRSDKAASTVTASHEKALQDIVEKRMRALPKHSKTLPPLTPLSPPVARPPKPAVLSKASTPATARDPVPEEPSSPRIIQAAGQPASPSSPRKDPVPQASGQPPREPSKKPATAEITHVRKEDVTKARPKASVADSTPSGKAPSTKDTPPVVDQSESRLPPERKLLHRAPAKSNDTAKVDTPTSRGPHAKPRDHSTKPQTGVSEKPLGSIKATARKVSAEFPAEIAPSPPPRTSTDEIKVGTAARPIITKEDLLEARRVREKQKARSQDKPAQPKIPSSSARSTQDIVGSKRGADQRPGSQPEASSKTDAIRQTPRRDTARLFDSDIQNSMKSVIEQVVWTVQRYERKFGISNHKEMRDNKTKILNFIHGHLDGPASRSEQSGLSRRQSVDVEKEDHGSRTTPVLAEETESRRRTSDSRKAGVRTVKANRLFVVWKEGIQGGNRPLKEIANEAEELRQTVAQYDMKVIHFSENDLIIQLKELGEISAIVFELDKRLINARSEIRSLRMTEHLEETEFGQTFGIIKCAALWMFFLAEQVTQTWKSYMESSRVRARGFARDVYEILIKESHLSGAPEAKTGLIKRVRRLKSLIGKLEDALGMANNGKSVSLTIQELVSKFADICKVGNIEREAKEALTGPGAGSNRGTPSTIRPDSTIRRSSAVKSNGNQQAKQSSRGTPAPGTSNGANLSRGLAASQHEKSTAPVTIPRAPTSPKPSPAIPRRPSEPVSPRVSQAGPNSRGPTINSASATRRQNTNLLSSLMESARAVHGQRQTASTKLANKRKAEEDGDKNSSESDGKPSKKRRVRFAPNLVQGAQSTPHSKEALSSLFFDGYDLLGNTTSLQKAAVEERASQMSRGSVIATFGFIRSYIGALKAEKDGHNCGRPEWVRLPYTSAMKRDIYRYMERHQSNLPPGAPLRGGPLS